MSDLTERPRVFSGTVYDDMIVPEKVNEICTYLEDLGNYREAAFIKALHKNSKCLCDEAADELERWRAFRNEMQEQQRQLEKVTERFLELDAFDKVAECATKAEGIRYVVGRMPKYRVEK